MHDAVRVHSTPVDPARFRDEVELIAIRIDCAIRLLDLIEANPSPRSHELAATVAYFMATDARELRTLTWTSWALTDSNGRVPVSAFDKAGGVNV